MNQSMSMWYRIWASTSLTIYEVREDDQRVYTVDPVKGG